MRRAVPIFRESMFTPSALRHATAGEPPAGLTQSDQHSRNESVPIGRTSRIGPGVFGGVRSSRALSPLGFSRSLSSGWVSRPCVHSVRHRVCWLVLGCSFCSHHEIQGTFMRPVRLMPPARAASMPISFKVGSADLCIRGEGHSRHQVIERKDVDAQDSP